MGATFSFDEAQIWLSGTYLSSVTGSDFTGVVTEINVAGGEREVEQIPCFGSGTNNYMFRKPQTLREGTIKFHVRDNNLWLGLAGGSYASGVPQQWSGYALKYPVTITYDFKDRMDVSGAHFRAIFDKAEITSHTWSMAKDGAMEGELSFKCLPNNYTEKFTPNRIVSALT